MSSAEVSARPSFPNADHQTARLQTKTVTKVLEVDGGTIAFDDTGGDGALIIAVPGMGDLRGEYRYLAPYLTKAGYRVVTVDVRGHGESSREWNDYSARAVGRDLSALRRHLERDQAVIIGNSFSAGAALWAAHDEPKSVTAAVLIGPVLRDRPGGLPWYLRAVLSIGLNGPWRVAFWLMYWTGLFPLRKPSDFAQYRNTLQANLKEPGRMKAVKAMMNLPKTETEGMLQRSPFPVLVIMGTKDADFPDPKAESQWIADRIGAEQLILEGAGHYPQTELPERVGPAIVQFLQGAIN